MTSLHVICDLGLPQSKILGTPMNWRSSKKTFLKTFFFGEHLRLCPWSLASNISVLGLERVCPRKGCPWPRIFFCVVGLGLEPCVLDSTSGILSPVITKQQSSLKHHMRKLALRATLTMHQLPIIAQVTFTQTLETGG